MSQEMGHELNDADRAILGRLVEGRDDDAPWGRNAPQNLADELGYSRQYVQNRLQVLKAANHVENIGGGVYEITEDGLDALADAGDSDA